MSSNELLQYAISQGIISVSNIQEQIDMKKRAEILSKHPYSIWEGKDGKWYTRLPDETKGKVLKKRSTKKSIEDVVVKYYSDQEERPILNKIFFMWIEEKLEFGEITKSCYDRYVCDYNRFFKNNSISQKSLLCISEDDLEVFIRKSIVDFDLTAKGFSNLRTIINGIFKYGKKKKFTQISITHFFGDLDLSKRIFKKNIKDKESQVFFEDEIPVITQYLKDNPTIENLGLLLTFQTGLRVGELSALKECDIKGKMIHVQRTEIKYKCAKTGKQIHEVREFPKTDAGNRYLIITESTLDTIQMIKNANSNAEYLFEKNGKRILACNFGKRIINVCKELEIRPRSMHKIRKTYGTTLLDANVDESIIVEQMGHSDIECTKQYYYYSNKNIDKKEAQISNAISI